MSHVHQLLLGYQLGESSEGERAAVEAHLPECADCLRRFLAEKRRFNLWTDGDERPALASRERLRREVARALAPEPRRFWRPVFVAAAAVAAALTLAFWLERHPRLRSSQTLIDTGSDSPTSQVL